MNPRLRRLAFALPPLWLMLSACAGQPAGGAAQAVEAYVQAVVAKNTEQAINASCADWETQAQLQIDSFEAAATSLEGLACETAGAEGGYTLVRCAGKIVASYNNENQEFSLEGRTYRVVEEGGQWRMCGYQ